MFALPESEDRDTYGCLRQHETVELHDTGQLSFRVFLQLSDRNFTGPPPAALRRLSYGSEQWTRQVMAVGSSINRGVGQVESLVEKAVEIGQFWLRGVSVARALASKLAGAS